MSIWSKLQDLKSLKKKSRILSEGNNLNLLEGPNPSQCILHFKESETFQEKASYDCRFTHYFMEKLHQQGINTQLIKPLNMKELLVQELVPFPFKMRVKSMLPKTLRQSFLMPEKTLLSQPFVDFFMGDEILSDSNILSLSLLDQEDLSYIKKIALRSFDFLNGMMVGQGYKIGSLDLQFGHSMTPPDYSEGPQGLDYALCGRLSLDHMTLLSLDSKKMLEQVEKTPDLYKTLFQIMIQKG